MGFIFIKNKFLYVKYLVTLFFIIHLQSKTNFNTIELWD